MKMTKRLMTMAMCGIMAASSMVGINASAGFSSTLLKDAGSTTYLGFTYNFKNAAKISTDLIKNTNQMKATGTVTLYEKDGIEVPHEVDMFVSVDLYNEEGTLLRSDCENNDNNCKNLAVSVEYTGSKYGKYYCKGYTRVGNHTTVDTYETSTIGV